MDEFIGKESSFGYRPFEIISQEELFILGPSCESSGGLNVDQHHLKP